MFPCMTLHPLFSLLEFVSYLSVPASQTSHKYDLKVFYLCIYLQSEGFWPVFDENLLC